MQALFVVLIVVACLLLMLIILVQNPKGGGLSSAFGGQSTGQMFGGAKRSGDFLDKATWGLALIIFVMVLGINLFKGTSGDGTLEKSEISEEVQGLAPQLNLNNTIESAPAGEDLPEPVEE